MAMRQRSRSPLRQVSPFDISRLVISREQARLAKDWSQADALRTQLQDAGVQLFDKTNQWKLGDGEVSGRIPSFDEIEAGVEPAALLSALPAEPVPDNADAAMAEIRRLISQREHARGTKDFEQADRIRAELQDFGVELLDKEKLWKCPSRGLQGIITGYRQNELSDVEVSTLVLQREKARMGNDYALSDMIRDELKSRGVTIDDKRKTWACTDGRAGAVPSWGQITGEASLAAPALPLLPQRPIPAAVPTVMPAQARAKVPTVEEELVSLAIAAARHPDTAARALQALRQVFAMGAVAQVRPLPTARVPMAAPAPQAQQTPRRQELTQALQLIKRCKDGVALSDQEIGALVAARERFRMTKDYASSDDLRNELQSIGIELFEKEKKWTSTDGRQGEIPLWSSISI